MAWSGAGWLVATLGLAGHCSAAAAELRFVSMHFPPYVEQHEGRAGGGLVRVVEEACRRLQWTCVVQVLPWRRAQQEIERGQADGAFPLLETAARRRSYYLSRPVVDIEYAFFGRAGQDFTYRPGERLGARQVGVFGPSGTATALQELLAGQPTRVVQEPDNGVVLRKLLAGRYGPDGLAFVNRDVAWQLAYEQGLLGLREAGVARSASYVIGLARQGVDEPGFQAFAQVLAELCRSGAMAGLLEPQLLPSRDCRRAADNAGRNPQGRP